MPNTTAPAISHYLLLDQEDEPMSTPMPALFVGHGSPMLTLGDNPYNQAWRAMGQAVPRPRGIVCISAHWYIDEVSVTAMEHPPTIHDFGGFPRELFDIEYPAPGSPELAHQVRHVAGDPTIEMDHDWGLDHGTWSVLRHLYPDADVPVVQLGINANQPAQFHYDLGRALGPLRDEGILIVASGNLVHNLRAYAWHEPAGEPYDWATSFEAEAREFMESGEHQALVDFRALGRDAAMAVPTDDHYLPLLYILGLQRTGEPLTYPVEGFDGRSMSMLSVRIG